MNDTYYDAGGYSGQEPRIEGFLVEDIREFVGPNADKYIEKFYKISQGEKTYNWPCAIFLTYWMAYRKMWKPAILYCIILSIISGIIQGFGFGIQMICNLVLLLYYFFHMGYQGNILYWNFVKEELTKEGLADISQPNYPIREHLGKRGGTSILFLLAFILLSSMISSILAG